MYDITDLETLIENYFSYLTFSIDTTGEAIEAIEYTITEIDE